MLYTGFVQVMESFGKLWKMIMQFSRKVLEKKAFQNGYGKFWIVVWGYAKMS